MKGIIFDIVTCALRDGPGIRTTIFLKGCPLRCWWCHNPEGLLMNKQVAYLYTRCIRCKKCILICPNEAIRETEKGFFTVHERCDACGRCVEVCPTAARKIVGESIDANKLMKEIEKHSIYYDASDGGVTFSGGEPLYQPEFLLEMLKLCKSKRLHIALDTSGYAPMEIFKAVANMVDLFLYDIKLMDESLHMQYTATSNDLIKRNLIMLSEENRGKDVIIRFPVITGITDTEENVKSIAKFLSGLKGISIVELLPFHDVYEKYEMLGMEGYYKMKGVPPPSRENLISIKEELERIGMYVKI